MGQNSISSDNPLKGVPEDRIERELRNNYHILHGIDQRLENITRSVEANTANIEILEEAVSQVVVIPGRPYELRFDHVENTLWINNKISIRLEDRQSEVFGFLFVKTSGKPKLKHIIFDDIVDSLSDFDGDKNPTTNAIYLRIKQVERKLTKVFKERNPLVVTTKEFYFLFK